MDGFWGFLRRGTGRKGKGRRGKAWLDERFLRLHVFDLKSVV
jgi:hypothetical protein